MTFDETLQALRSGALDLIEYVDGLCDRIEKDEPAIRALIPGTYDRRRVRADARRLLSAYPAPATRPALFGLPVGVKDIINVAGYPTRCGSDLPPEVFDGPEANCISRLKGAGSIIMGKTVTAEFAYFKPGPTRNPHHTGHTPGGSSSGSAAGVADGFFPLALGTQTGGSTIRPAAYCGVVGFKPGFGRISLEGVMPLSKTLDHLGLFCADPTGIDPVMQVLDETWRPVGASKPLEELTLGVPDGSYLALATPHGLSLFENAVARLKQQGCRLKRVETLSEIDIINQDHLHLMNAEIARAHAGWYARYGPLYSQTMSDAITQGRRVAENEIERLKAEAVLFRKRMENEMKHEGIDAWICPSCRDSAPKGLDSTGSPIMNFSWTYAGLPALSLPAGRDETGLPYGVQLVGMFGKDELLVSLAPSVHAALNRPRQV